jgi:hypothetical protein
VSAEDSTRSPEHGKHDYQLLLRSEVNNNPTWHVAEPSRQRDIWLRFDYFESSQVYVVSASGRVFDNQTWSGKLPKPREDLIAAIDQHLGVWQRKVAYRQDQAKSKVFQNRLDFSAPADQPLVDSVWLEIARAGEALAKILFWGGDEGLDEIRDRLFEAIAAPRDLASPLLVTVQSDDLFAPWWMLYTPPDEGPTPDAASPPAGGPAWRIDGFWGYKHLGEHQTKRTPYARNATDVVGLQVRTGLNVDPRIDVSAPFVGPVTSFLDGRVTPVLRELKEDLRTAFVDGTFADEITYFGCHCTTPPQGAPYLALRDGEPITAADVDSWLPGKAGLLTRPVVFINACQGGRMSSLFFGTLGKKMLAKGANSVVGPQIDIPVQFGAEYAKRLFEQFLTPEQRLGDAVLGLARQFADSYRNPLGLTYSLYRGVDVYLARPN